MERPRRRDSSGAVERYPTAGARLMDRSLPRTAAEMHPHLVRLVGGEQPSLARVVVWVASAQKVSDAAAGAVTVVVAELGSQTGWSDSGGGRHKPEDNGMLETVILKRHPHVRTDRSHRRRTLDAERQHGHRPRRGISGHRRDANLNPAARSRVHIVDDRSSMNRHRASVRARPTARKRR